MTKETKDHSETHRWSFIHNAWILNESWNDREELATMTHAAEVVRLENVRLREQLAAQSRELDAIVTKLGCHRAYVLQELDQVLERADSKPGSDEYRQLQVKYNDLLRVAVKIADAFKGNFINGNEVARLAAELLSTPSATAFMEHHQACSISGYTDSDGCPNPPACHPNCQVQATALQQAKEEK